MLALTADKALLIVTHDPALVDRCGRVVVLGPARHPDADETLVPPFAALGLCPPLLPATSIEE